MKKLSFVRGPVSIAGVAALQEMPDGVHPRRLPEAVWPILDLMTRFAQSSPSGVRIVFETDSPTIELEMLPMVLFIPALGREPAAASVDLVIDGELVGTASEPGGRRLVLDLADGLNAEIEDGPAVRFRFADLGTARKRVELWLPPSGDTALMALEVEDGASVDAVEDMRKRWVHHGSSISQCSEATSPARIWPGVTARRADLHLTNIGLGGSCHLDPYTARYIRDLRADYISLKLGINVVNLASMRERTFVPAIHGFLDTVRDGHPETPIVVASPIICPSAEDRPGPTEIQPDGKFLAVGAPEDIPRGALTLQRIRELLSGAVALRRGQGDTNLHYLDGLALFGKDDADDLPDALHPNGAGYERMGERFYARVFAPGGILG